jgi:hypothetical protein
MIKGRTACVKAYCNAVHHLQARGLSQNSVLDMLMANNAKFEPAFQHALKHNKLSAAIVVFKAFESMNMPAMEVIAALTYVSNKANGGGLELSAEAATLLQEAIQRQRQRMNAA